MIDIGGWRMEIYGQKPDERPVYLALGGRSLLYRSCINFNTIFSYFSLTFLIHFSFTFCGTPTKVACRLGYANSQKRRLKFVGFVHFVV